jgi:GWxTD domain-containing protein
MKRIRGISMMHQLARPRAGHCWTFLVILIMILLVAASDVCASTAGRSERLFLNLDFAHFRGDSTRSFVEVYYSFSVGQLHYIKDGEKFSSAAKFDLDILEPQTNAVVYQKNWKVPHSVSDTALLEQNKSLVGVLGVWVKPDHYLLRLTGLDVNDEKNRDSLDVPMNLWSFPTDSLSLSDVELCSSIKQIPADTSNIFYKNTLEVIPNPSVLYGVGLPIMYYYVEAYGLMSKVKDGEYAYAVAVLDAAGHEVIGQSRTKRRVHDSSVEVGTINLGKLKSGTYTLRFSLNDSMAQQQTTSSKKFFVYNPGVTGPAAQGGTGLRGEYISSEYALMDEKALDKEFEYSRYIALNDEVDRFEHLSGVDAKKKFMYEFWKHRDPDLTTTENELKKEYLARVEYVNLNFRAGTKEGWRTDRGRVYIMYGAPDEFERHPNEIDSKAYEIWQYHSIQGGVEFDFIDRSGFSDYILVNSTHRSEIRDDNWQRQLKTQ